MCKCISNLQTQKKNAKNAVFNFFFFFLGIKNLDKTLDHAFQHFGLKNATEVIVTGGSAGGLSTFLHVDRISNRFDNNVKIRAAPIVGFFLDHSNIQNSDQNYTAWMK